MSRTLRAVVVSASLAAESRNRALAAMAHDAVMNARGWTSSLVDLRELDAPNFDDGDIYEWDGYGRLHGLIRAADAIVMASPVYNWDCSSELKKFIEYIGSTPPDGSLVGALFDKVVTLLTAGGIPQSYMAFTGTAMSLMLDFKCIINPYNVHVPGED